METFIIYIIKSSICLGVFLLIYVLFLRKTTFFKFNRFFLLSGFIFSLIIPAIKYTYDIVLIAPISSLATNSMDKNSAIEYTLNIWTIVFAIYIIGITVSLIKQIFIYNYLRKIKNQGSVYQNNMYTVIYNTSVKSPFSIFNYIFFTTESLDQFEQEVIMKHEIAHIRQKHWIDLVCAQCMLIIQWFNPFAWIYLYMLKENHEYLADSSVLSTGISPALYQAVLINREFNKPIFSFTNTFNYPKSLNRLNMMKKAKSPQWKKTAILLIVPVFGAFIWASATPRYILTSDTESNANFREMTESQQSARDSIKIRDKKTERFTMTNIPISEGQSKSRPLIIVDNKKVEDINTVSPDDIESVNVLKGEDAINAYGEDGKNGVIRIVSKKNDISEAMIIIDGEIADQESLKSIKPDNIEKIEILKGISATKIYGEKAKNGAIMITTKK